MTGLDWGVMLFTLLFIVAYGTWKTWRNRNIGDYLLGDKHDRWWTIGLSVMATQASAITFLSTPGQAYNEGMGFVQFYFGLPIAMIIISVVFIPLYYRLKVYTAYEFLESRFNLRMRMFTAFLFLMSRGLAAGITIYAPAIILSQILGWSLTFTNIFIGVLVIIYTVSGGTRAVSQTHKQQMAVIFLGMFIAFGFLVYYIGQSVGLRDALRVAGKMGKMEIIELEFNAESRYNIWSGLIGGLFLQLSYFGTDQSQVQRYLSGSSVRESRLGLLFNGMVKIPMQFFILLTGVLVFLFYQFHQPPVFFNQASLNKVEQQDSFQVLQQQYDEIFDEKQKEIAVMVSGMESGNSGQVDRATASVNRLEAEGNQIRNAVAGLISRTDPNDKTVSDGKPKDHDYVFIWWVTHFLPAGLVGLLLAVIFSGAMSSTSSELTSLASTTTVDFYKRAFVQNAGDQHYVWASRSFTLLFGILAIVFATLASLFENLIQAVNILGSLFYGTILGIFLVAFFVKRVQGNAVFIAALLTQTCIIVIFVLGRMEIMELGYLWYNLLGPALVIILSMILQELLPGKPPATES
ncbi:MAG: sodium:solute symporter [Bacteroidia bacterium]